MEHTTIRVLVDPTAPGSAQLMELLTEQLTALDVGTVEVRKEPPPPGTLADPLTVVIVLKITYWSIKIGYAIFEIVRDARERQAASLKQPLKNVPEVLVSAGDKSPYTLTLPARTTKQEEFLAEIERKATPR